MLRVQAGTAGGYSRLAGRAGIRHPNRPGREFPLQESHFLHCLPADRCEEVVCKAAGQLRPGGVAAVDDVEIAEPENELEGDDVTDSTVSFAGPGGRCWTLSQYETWLRDAGLVNVSGQRLSSGWYSSLVSAAGALQPARNLSMNRYWKHAGPPPHLPHLYPG